MAFTIAVTIMKVLKYNNNKNVSALREAENHFICKLFWH